ncbi:MAG: ABC transporter permease [Bacilli bacterium]|nr:ABC transporter permease [Bacilli bacterium]
MIFKRLKSKAIVNVTHFTALCKRYVSLILSDKFSFLTLILQAPIMLIVIKLACSKEFSYYYATTTMFVISAILVVMSTLNSYREVCKEREILIRETTAGLDSSAYILSKVVVQSIICFFQSLVIVIGTKYIIDFNIEGFVPYLHYFLFTWLILVCSTCIALFISSVLKSSDSAILPVLFIIIAQVVLSGAIIDLPKEISFISMITITRWALGGYSYIFDFKFLADNYSVNGMVFPQAIKEIYTTPYATVVLVLLGITIITIILSILTIKKLGKRKP